MSRSRAVERVAGLVWTADLPDQHSTRTLVTARLDLPQYFVYMHAREELIPAQGASLLYEYVKRDRVLAEHAVEGMNGICDGMVLSN